MNKKDAFRYAKQRGIAEDRISVLENTDNYMFTHLPGDCMGKTCTIHNRSDHGMRSFPQSWRFDRGIMERLNPFGGACPDPDSPWPSGSNEWVHGCIVNPYTNCTGMCQAWGIDGVEAAWIDRSYAVTKDGRVWSFIRTTDPTNDNQSVIDYSNHPRELKPRPNAKGYLRVQLHHKDKYVHHLVLAAWGGQRLEGHESSHMDGDVSNNHFDNLKWLLPSENNMMKHVHGSIPLGENHVNSKMTKNQVLSARKMWGDGKTLGEIVTELDLSVTRSSVHEAVRGKTWAWLKEAE